MNLSGEVLQRYLSSAAFACAALGLEAALDIRLLIVADGLEAFHHILEIGICRRDALVKHRRRRSACLQGGALLYGQAYLAVIINTDDHSLDLVAHVDMIVYILYKAFGYFGNMYHSALPALKRDESAEFGYSRYFTFYNFFKNHCLPPLFRNIVIKNNFVWHTVAVCTGYAFYIIVGYRGVESNGKLGNIILQHLNLFFTLGLELTKLLKLDLKVYDRYDEKADYAYERQLHYQIRPCFLRHFRSSLRVLSQIP